jgi:hypothetical protein
VHRGVTNLHSSVLLTLFSKRWGRVSTNPKQHASIRCQNHARAESPGFKQRVGRARQRASVVCPVQTLQLPNVKWVFQLGLCCR